MSLSRVLLSNTRSIAALPVARFRSLHATTGAFLAKKTKGQVPDAARDPEEHTLLDQNPHLKHAASSKGGNEGRDTGKGNAAPDPELPSKRKPTTSSAQTPGKGRSSVKNDKRRFHTSTLAQSGAGKEHSADNYFKEVDENAPSSDETFRVDGTSEATHRPHQQWGDPQAEYASVSKDEPYEPPVETNNGEKPEQKDQKLRYGNTKRDATRHAPKEDEGPQAKDAEGLKTSSQVEV